MAATLQNEQQLFEPHMKGPLTGSILFHLAFIILAVVGLPYFTPELPDIDTSITVELVDPSEALPAPNKPQPRKQPTQLKDKPPKPVAPQVVAKKPPKPVAPAPPEKSEFVPPEKDAPEPMKKPEPVKAKETPKEVKKKPVLTRDPEEEQEEFKSLLRNLMPTEEEAAQAEENRKGEQSALERFSQQMNPGELGALKAQLNGCWSVLAGARYAEDLVVELKLFVNPDRTIRDVQITNQLRYNTDKFFRAAAEGAQRAVFRCSPLDLPPNKYDLWKTITVTFDPRKML